MKGTELIVAEKLNAEVLFTKDGELDKVMAIIRSKVGEFEPDLETATGRKEIASMSRKVSSSKSFLDGIRKAQNSKAKAEIDGRNGLWKPVKEELDELRDSTRKPLTDWEYEEEAAAEVVKAQIRAKIDGFKALFSGLNGTGTQDQLNAVIGELAAVEVEPEEYFDFYTEAQDTIYELLTRAHQDLETRIRLDKEQTEREAEAKRLEAVAKEQAEAATKLKEQQDAIDAANHKIEEERAAIEAEKQAEIERKDREQFEREAKLKAEAHAQEAARVAKLDAILKAEQAELDRIAKIKSDEEEAERKAALLPDKEKLEGFAQWLDEEIAYPQVNSPEAKEIVEGVKIAIGDLAYRISTKSMSM